MALPDLLGALWRRIAYRPADDHGPGGAFARTMAAVVTGEGIEEVLDEDDGMELLCRALDPDHARRDLNYPGWDRVAGSDKERGFEAGLEILRGALLSGRLEDGDEVTVDLLVGTLIPVPGPGRQPVIHEITLEPEGEEARFARVDYAYDEDPVGHSLNYYRDADDSWRLDLVWELAKGGAMSEALGMVQTPGCRNEKLDV